MDQSRFQLSIAHSLMGCILPFDNIYSWSQGSSLTGDVMVSNTKIVFQEDIILSQESLNMGGRNATPENVDCT
jgi:hypothetical protein